MKIRVISCVATLAAGVAFAGESPVDVVCKKDVGWTCRQTAEGCVLDFTNKVGVSRQKDGSSKVDLHASWRHVNVTYRPTGLDYNFVLGPTGTLSVVLNDKMPKLPARFNDAARYVRVNANEPFDVGTTAVRPSQRINSNRHLPQFFIRTVPCEMYTRGWVLCRVADDPAKERKFTLRITRWYDSFEHWYNGRAVTAMAATLVDFDTAKKVKLPAANYQLSTTNSQLWLVEFPIDLGNIQDVVHTDTHGNFLDSLGRYLDVEICGPLKTRVSALQDTSMDTDPERVSAITVFGVALERPSATFAMNWTEPGNVFGFFDARETLVNLSVKRPGKYTLSWTVTDGETGRVSKERTHAFSSDEAFRLDLADYAQPGWYALDWRLADEAGQTLMTHAASFAVLGRDSRQARAGEGPYTAWSALNFHYMTPTKLASYNAELFEKAGIRMVGAWLFGRFQEPDFVRNYKIGPALFAQDLQHEISLKMTPEDEAKLVETYKKRLKDYPEARVAQLFWESSPQPYRQAPELTGGKFDPSADPIPNRSNRVLKARAVSQFMRKHVPDVKISIGQSLCCTELVAEQIRAGLGDKDIDCMGLEHVGRGNLPERPGSSSMTSATFFRDLAKRLGRPSWRVICGVETNCRLDTFLGQERQARFYMRDALIGIAWRQPIVNLGGICDAGNQYSETPWGHDALCKRWPYLYPKKAYVAYAALTKALDCVEDAKSLATGDDCAYALACTRRDGKRVCAIWTSYGTADYEIKVENGGKVTLMSFFGRESEVKPQGGTVRITATERPQYLIVENGAVSSVKTLKRAYPEDAMPKDYKMLVACNDATKWRIVPGKIDGVFGDLGKPFPTCRQPAKAPGFAVVDDPEKGKCLELDLGEPDRSLPDAVFEYACLELREPVAIPGKPQSLGATVKGNSGWGRIYWILEGADGKRAISSGHRDWDEDFDDIGKMTLGFTGWRFLGYPVGEHSSIRDYTINCVSDLWRDGTDGGAVKYPAKLVGVILSATARPLYLTEHREKRQKVRLADIGFYDFNQEK